MARGRLNYSARMRAARVSSHTTEPIPIPTLADLAATVFYQRWRGPQGTSVTFHVLALDAAHAVVLGELQIGPIGGVLDVNVAQPDASIDTKARILTAEPSVVRAHRQALFRERAR